MLVRFIFKVKEQLGIAPWFLHKFVLLPWTKAMNLYGSLDFTSV